MLSASLAVHADTLLLEQTQGTFRSGATLTGTVTLDETTHNITSANLTEQNIPVQYSATNVTYTVFDQKYDQGGYLGNYNVLYAFDSLQVPSDQIALLFTSYSYDYATTPSSVLCTVDDNPCDFTSVTFPDDDSLQYATVTPMVTPEPSALPCSARACSA